MYFYGPGLIVLHHIVWLLMLTLFIVVFFLLLSLFTVDFVVVLLIMLTLFTTITALSSEGVREINIVFLIYMYNDSLIYLLKRRLNNQIFIHKLI